MDYIGAVWVFGMLLESGDESVVKQDIAFNELLQIHMCVIVCKQVVRKQNGEIIRICVHLLAIFVHVVYELLELEFVLSRHNMLKH